LPFSTHLHSLYCLPSPPRRSPPTSPLSFLITPPPPRSTLFPYTTLFRSHPSHRLRRDDGGVAAGLPAADGRPRLPRRAVEDEVRSEEHTSELQSLTNLVCRLLLEKKKIIQVRLISCFVLTLLRQSLVTLS